MNLVLLDWLIIQIKQNSLQAKKKKKTFGLAESVMFFGKVEDRSQMKLFKLKKNLENSN